MLARDAEYVVFDVETTGLSVLGGDRMLEIAAIKMRAGRIVDEFESFINPERDIPAEAQEVNQITVEMIQDAPTRDVVLPKMLEFIGGACVVGHNVKFDLNFLCYELSLIGRKLRDETPALDTLKMAKRFLPQLTTHRLSYVAHFLGVPVDQTHRALADVKLTGAVLTHFLNMSEDQQLGALKEVFKEFGVEKPRFKPVQPRQEMLF